MSEETLKFRTLNGVIEINGLEDLLRALVKIPDSEVDLVIGLNVSEKSNPVADWVEKKYPDRLILQIGLRDIQGYTPQQIREQFARSLRKSLET